MEKISRKINFLNIAKQFSSKIIFKTQSHPLRGKDSLLRWIDETPYVVHWNGDTRLFFYFYLKIILKKLQRIDEHANKAIRLKKYFRKSLR
jgi:hypothetical protein